jgi:hypothetical protein
MPPKFWLKYHTFFVLRPIKFMTVLLLLPNTFMCLANDANWKLNYEEDALSFFYHLCGSHDRHQTMGHVHSQTIAKSYFADGWMDVSHGSIPVMILVSYFHFMFALQPPMIEYLEIIASFD